MRRYLAMALLLLVLPMLFMDWFTYEPIAFELRASFQDMLEPVDESRKAEMNEKVEELVTQMETGISPYDFNRLVTFFTQALLRIPNRPSGMNVTIVLGLFGAACALFWLVVLLLVKLFVQHLFGRRPRGVFTLLLLWVHFAAALLLAYAVYMDTGRQVLTLTAAGFVAAGAMLASCIAWGSHLRHAGVQKDGWSWPGASFEKCPRCGTVQTGVNMICGTCGAYLSESLDKHTLQ